MFSFTLLFHCKQHLSHFLVAMNFPTTHNYLTIMSIQCPYPRSIITVSRCVTTKCPPSLTSGQWSPVPHQDNSAQLVPTTQQLPHPHLLLVTSPYIWNVDICWEDGGHHGEGRCRERIRGQIIHMRFYQITQISIAASVQHLDLDI